MKSVVIFSTANLYYGNSAAVVRMNLYARALALANVRVYLLSTERLTNYNTWTEVEDGIYTLAQEEASHNNVRNPFTVYKLIKKTKKLLADIGGEVVILNYSSTHSLVLDLLLLLLCRDYSLFSEVNEVRRYVSETHDSLKYKLYCFVLEKTYKYYDGIVFINKNIQEYYRKIAPKSVVIPILSDCTSNFRASSGLETLDFVFIGTVSFAKENLEEVLEGFVMFAKKHPAARLLLYGLLLESDKRRLDSFLSNSDLPNSVVYKGPLPHNEVPNVLSSAGALLLSRSNNKQNFYGFSTKLSEYAVSGTPIVMTNTGVVSDYFTDGVSCLMCDGYDRDSFYRKFEELAQMSHDEKEVMARQAFHVAQKNFDYRSYSNELSNFFFNK